MHRFGRRAAVTSRQISLPGSDSVGGGSGSAGSPFEFEFCMPFKVILFIGGLAPLRHVGRYVQCQEQL